MSIQGIHLYYINGARGDFLASILCNEPFVPGFKFHLSKKPFVGYTKQHCKNEPIFCPMAENNQIETVPENYIKMLILPSDAQSIVDISYLRIIKNMSKNASPDLLKWVCSMTYQHSMDSLTDMGNYDYVVKFNDLNNAEYLKGLYCELHGKNLLLEEMGLIQKNIDAQPSVNSNPEYTDVRNEMLSKYRNFNISI